MSSDKVEISIHFDTTTLEEFTMWVKGLLEADVPIREWGPIE